MSNKTNERLAHLYWRRCKIRGEIEEVTKTHLWYDDGEVEVAVKKAYIAGLRAAAYYHMYESGDKE